MSVGFHIQCCECNSVWYRVTFYLLLELFPITVFYLVILILQINITSAPMTCYIMYSQLAVIWWACAFDGEDSFISKRMFVNNESSELFYKVVLSLYDIWNLRFFQHLLPPLCVSQNLKAIHIALLGYISLFYPLILMFLTWVCVELHGHNFRPLVWLWRPFHRCFVRLRRKWNTKSDIIDVFASFFLLSFSKVMYQAALMLSPQTIQNYDHGILIAFDKVTNVDLSVVYGSNEHLALAVPAVLLSIIFNVLPTLLLILYPFRKFRALLSVCRLKGIALNFFVEKFYSCYRNGLDGGKDMRSFAGLYFITRPLMFVGSSIGSLLMVSNNDPYLVRNLVLMVTALLIGLCRPYKEVYMNVLDTLLLAHFGLFCHLISSYQGFEVGEKFVLVFKTMSVLPFGAFVLFFVMRAIQRVQKSGTLQLFRQKCKHLVCCNKFSTENRPNTPDHVESQLTAHMHSVNTTSVTYGTLAFNHSK